MARLLDGRYKRCDKVIVVCDNLNTHTKGAFYEAFPPVASTGEIQSLRDETSAWETFSNERQRGVEWHFKIADARTKLRSLYPKIKV